MSTYFLIAILLLGFVITFQIAKASEYVGILKGEKKNNEQNNRINGFLMILFLVLGLIGVYWCNELFKGKILGKSASVQGEKIDQMLYITIAITGFVFFITHFLLFWFSFKYQYSEKIISFYFPHNNKLEVIWTVVPAIALTVLVGFGLMYWFQITGEARGCDADRDYTAASSSTGSIAMREKIMSLEKNIIGISVMPRTILSDCYGTIRLPTTIWSSPAPCTIWSSTSR